MRPLSLCVQGGIRGWEGIILSIMLKKYKWWPCKHGVIAYTFKYWNISVVSAVLIEIFQHNQQSDTLLPVTPCAHKLKAGIAYWASISFPEHARSQVKGDLTCERACSGNEIDWACENFSQDISRYLNLIVRKTLTLDHVWWSSSLSSNMSERITRHQDYKD
jgi:hypothetical protein